MIIYPQNDMSGHKAPEIKEFRILYRIEEPLRHITNNIKMINNYL